MAKSAPARAQLVSRHRPAAAGVRGVRGGVRNLPDVLQTTRDTQDNQQPNQCNPCRDQTMLGKILSLFALEEIREAHWDRDGHIFILPL